MTEYKKSGPAVTKDRGNGSPASSLSQNSEHRFIRTGKKIACAGVLLFILILTRQHIMSFLKWPPEVYSDPKVFNLSKEKVEWDVYYGQPQLCGKLECHLLEGYAETNFSKKAVLPSREFPLEGYEQGQIIYYRTTVDIPKQLLGQDEILVFHSVFIWAEKYRFYVNGHFVYAGGKDMLNIPIPLHLVPTDGKLTLHFRVDPGSLRYQGLAHMGDLIIGPKSAFVKLEHVAHDLTHSYYLWHMLPRLTTCLVFVFFFFAVARGTEMFMFVLYAFAGSMHIYFLSNLPNSVLEDAGFKEYFSQIFSVLSSVLFFALVRRFFRCPSDKWSKAFTIVGAGLVLGTVLMVYNVNLGSAYDIIGKWNYGLRIVGSCYAVYMSIITWRMLKKSGKSPSRQKASLVFLFFNGVVLVVYTLVVLKVIPGLLWPATIFVSDTLLLIVFAALVSQEFGTVLVQRDQIKDTFRRFIGASVADSVVSAGADLRPTQRNVSVLFCDIRSFTAMCENSDPGKIFQFLNEYFDMMVRIISQHGGVVDKFGGDSIMAVWGVPDANDLHGLYACKCAVAMREALVDYNHNRAGKGLERVRIGIGIHSGPVMAGAIGSSDRQEYTVIGDTVNTASRIEGLTKKYETELLVSGATWELVEEYAVGHTVGSSVVKGRIEPIDLYEIKQITVDDIDAAEW